MFENNLYIWFLLALFLLGLYFYIKNKNKARQKTPLSLARQIYRYPERVFVDIPMYLDTLNGPVGSDFLLRTEEVLASIGELKSRRAFVLCFAEVIKSPSYASLKDMTNFLFVSAPPLFTETISWDGRCNPAINFFKVTRDLIDALERGEYNNINKKSRKHKKNQSPKSLEKIDERDLSVIREWEYLHALTSKILSIVVKNRRKINHNSVSQSLNDLAVDENAFPHLIPFYKAVFDLVPRVVVDK